MNSDILIFGGGGDLAFRKLYPALYHLDVAGCLPESLKIIGVARKADERQAFLEKVREWFENTVSGTVIDEDVWERFCNRLNYMATDATSPESLGQLKEALLSDESRDLIVYLSTPPTIFSPICQAMQAVGLVRPNTRIVVEKPLGDNLESFREINKNLTDIFEEHQVFRIDHYLGKETVQNLLALRFANTLFEPLWNNNYIDNVQITVAEKVGAEGRWDFYDGAGAMRDMVQNHLLQLLCLAAMEPPSKLNADSVRDEKLKVLRSLHRMDRTEVKNNTVRGQYAAGAVDGKPVVGYLQEEGAAPRSDTETFVAIKAHIDNWRWAGVPFYLRTGKRLPVRYSEIVIQFKDVAHSIFGSAEVGNPNDLIIRLQPDEGIRLQVMNKVPGLDASIPMQEVTLNLSFSEAFESARVPEAYERLLFDVIRNNPTLFVRSDEVEEAWKWVDQIRDGWDKNAIPPESYTAGSQGPSKSIGLVAKEGRHWHEFK